MKIRKASAVWEGPMMEGQGRIQQGCGHFEHAEKAKAGCPGSQALAATKIRLSAKLV